MTNLNLILTTSLYDSNDDLSQWNEIKLVNNNNDLIFPSFTKTKIKFVDEIVNKEECLLKDFADPIVQYK